MDVICKSFSLFDLSIKTIQEKIEQLQPFALNADDLIGIGVNLTTSSRKNDNTDTAIVYKIRAPPAFQVIICL